VDEFLERMSKHYEIVIFTASISPYANPLIDKLDTRRYVSHRLFREHCVHTSGVFIKDLKKIGRDLKDVIIVDVS
jgi:RNA polymerase II subunit A small phosphatase-like protein